MIYYAALIGCISGLLLGGNLKHMLDIKLKFISLIFVFGLLSALPSIPLFSQQLARFGNDGACILAILRYGSLIAFVFMNRTIASCVIIGIGGAMNMLVTLANAGRMPVAPAALGLSPNDLKDAALKSGDILNYTVENSATVLKFLADNIRIPGIEVSLSNGRYFSIVYYYASAGDLLITVGIFIFCLMLSRPRLITRFSKKPEKTLKPANSKIKILKI